MEQVAASPRIGWRTPPSAAGIAGCVGLIALATGAAHFLSRVLPPSSATLIFLVAVLISAASFGFWTGLLAAALAFLCANFFFVEPVHTFSVRHAEDVLALGVFLLAAAMTGFIAGRMREQADAARQRADMLQLLSDFSADLSGRTTHDEVGVAVVDHLARATGGAAALVEFRDDAIAAWRGAPAGATLEPADLQAADWAARHDARSAAAAPGWSGSRFTFQPLRRAGAGVSIVGYTPPQGGVSSEQVVGAILQQGAAAMERVELAREAARAREAAEQERLRSALLSSLSHDLRTPLAAILGSVTTLRELGDAMPPEARADLLAAIEEETGRLSRFVANLLAMTRLEAGVALERDWIDVGDILRAAVARARKAFPAQALDLALGSDLPLVRADATLLEQAIFNLIDNAARHSPAGEPVTLSARLAGEEVAIAVEDRGPGVAPEARGRIFEKFFTTSPSGVGLGLAICRGVVTALGGSIALEPPETPKGGARFVIRLKVEPAVQEA